MDTVPWELLYPVDGGNDNGFLVEQFPVVRRVYGQGRARHLRCPVPLLVPPGSPANAMDEVAVVSGTSAPHVRATRSLQPPRRADRAARKSPSVLHFACHNAFTGQGGLGHQPGRRPATPSDLAPAQAAAQPRDR